MWVLCECEKCAKMKTNFLNQPEKKHNKYVKYMQQLQYSATTIFIYLIIIILFLNRNPKINKREKVMQEIIFAGHHIKKKGEKNLKKKNKTFHTSGTSMEKLQQIKTANKRQSNIFQ